MRHAFGKKIVIALGGSIMYPEGIDSRFIREFKLFIEKFTKQGVQFLIVVGGGRVARVYQEAAEDVGTLTDDDKDWLGIHATRMNAHLIRTVFRDIANPVVIDHRGKIKKLTHPVTVSGGWHPGWSTDYVATALAEDFKVPEVVIVGKPDHVYDHDPSKHKNAKPLPELTWEEYRKLIPSKWTPGFHSPVDPIAAELGEKTGVKAIIVNGKDLKNIEALLKGKEFKGTIIS
jgi:uridylate kinase